MSKDKNETVSCGRDLGCVPNIESSLNCVSQQGFDFVCVPIVHPRFERDFILNLPPRAGPLTRSDLCLSSSDWTVFIVGKLSPWINLDSDLRHVRANSEKAFVEETRFAVHLSLPAIMIKVKSKNCVNSARCVYQLLNTRMCSLIWVHIPMRSPKDCSDYTDCVKDDEQTEDTWEWWNVFRTLCDNHRSLGLAIELSKELPPDNELDRWLGEPIKVGILSTNIFILNRKGYPVLPKPHQLLVNKLFKLNVQLILTGSSKVDKGIQSYKLYLDHLYQFRDTGSSEDEFCKGYEDYLQCPLQPLMDNLESQTYEVFEKDPVKYSQYQKITIVSREAKKKQAIHDERAICEALIDRVPADESATKVTVVMVVGAGRGPLVTATLKAATEAQRLVRVYAIEKNSNAIVTLRNLQLEEWGNTVTVVSCDMRKWQAPEKADIMVSELLGSFGDNELSPECLDGAQSFLKSDGISIPCSYTSHVVPISAPKLHADLSNTDAKLKNSESFYEMFYVVRLKNVHCLSDIQPCFTFVHPNKDIPINNERFCSLKFPISTSSMVHGFAGYFDTVLYNQITLSIVPTSYSQGMFSWFPIYIPVKVPFYVKKGEEIVMNLWRIVTENKVWYEWAVTSPTVTHVHNIYGQSQWIGL